MENRELQLLFCDNSPNEFSGILVFQDVRVFFLYYHVDNH